MMKVVLLQQRWLADQYCWCHLGRRKTAILAVKQAALMPRWKQALEHEYETTQLQWKLWWRGEKMEHLRPPKTPRPELETI
jgi:hypothetical protein